MAQPVRVLALVAGLAALGSAGALVACSSDSPASPTCKQNVTKNGVTVEDDGCDQFAQCLTAPDAGPVHTQDSCVCCAGMMGPDLALCLYGYGEPSDKTCGGADGGS
ncbi:MAG TPA: hypothetical protein VGM56_24010 [Byssovorax sp.]